MRYWFTFCLIVVFSQGYAQKMLVLERAYQAKTTKMYVGQTLRFRLAGEENYWYERTITDMLPESNLLLLDNFPVKLDSIVALRVNRRPIWRLIGGTLFTFGASLTVATTAAALYRDKDVKYGALYGSSAASLGVGYGLLTKRTLKLGKKHRLRIIEIKFPTPLIPPPPEPKRN